MFRQTVLHHGSSPFSSSSRCDVFEIDAGQSASTKSGDAHGSEVLQTVVGARPLPVRGAPGVLGPYERGGGSERDAGIWVQRTGGPV